MSVSLTFEERFVRFSCVAPRFIWNKSFTRTVISVNRPFIIRTHPVNVRFSRYMSGARTVIA